MSALDRQRVEQERIKLEEQIQEVRGGHSLIKKTTIPSNQCIHFRKINNYLINCH